MQKRRKELEEASVNDSFLLAKSSLELNLLPETEDDRNLASLLALRPSRSIEENKELTRNIILNSPALPSSSGLLTSFGGLKKEESLSKSVQLSRNALGIAIKRSKVDHSKTQVSDKHEANIDSQLESSINLCTSENIQEIKSSDSQDSTNLSPQKDIELSDEVSLSINVVQSVQSKVSLVGDYSSSGESTD